MKRLTTSIAVVLAALAAAFAIVGTSAQSASTYRVDAIFDTAKGVIPGQLVKIAGARVGSITDVALTEDYKARIIMDVPRRFTFRQDATCSIQPEGLISENFVQCDPGQPDGPELEGTGEDGVPTVPVENTRVPVSITDLFRIFQADIRQRFTVAIAALGGGFAARGSDMNEIIRRANPTLEAVRSLTSDLNAQKAQLRKAVTDTDAVIAELAERTDSVQAFIDQSRRISIQTADKSTELAESIRRLPELLDRTDLTIGDLNDLTRRGRPLLARLRTAAPGIERLIDNLEPFAEAARPNLEALSTTADIADGVIADTLPVVARLRSFAQAALPTGRLLNQLLVNLRERGFVESLNLFSYYAAAALSRFDSVSHIFPAHVVPMECSTFAHAPVEGCTTWFGPDRAAGSRSAPTAEVSSPQATGRRQAGAPAAATATPTPSGTQSPAPVLPPAESLGDRVDTGATDDQARDDLTDFLLAP